MHIYIYIYIYNIIYISYNSINNPIKIRQKTEKAFFSPKKTYRWPTGT